MRAYTLTCNGNTAKDYDENIVKYLQLYLDSHKEPELRRALSCVLHKLLFVNPGVYLAGATYSIGDLVKDIEVDDKIQFRAFIDSLVTLGVAQCDLRQLYSVLSSIGFYSFCKILSVPAVLLYRALLYYYTSKGVNSSCSLLDMVVNLKDETPDTFRTLREQFTSEY